jgi:hypothetical protein
MKGLLVAALVGVAAYWYWSPLLALQQMRTAAHARDAERFNSHVDYPRLRENMKEQLAGGEDASAATAQRSEAAQWGMLLKRAVIGGVLEATVRPETVMYMMRQGSKPPHQPHAETEPSASPAAPKLSWHGERPNLDTYILYTHKEGAADDDKLGFVMMRSGFASWYLVDLRVPRLGLVGKDD